VRGTEHADGDMNDELNAVLLWWATLSAISVINICVWVAEALRLRRRRSTEHASTYAARRHQLILSSLFVAGCAFRSFLPRAEAQRICLYDSWISAAAIARSIATIAELAIVAQWSALLRDYGRATGVRSAVVTSHLLLPLIGLAELFSWYTTLTTNFAGSVVEESLWAATATIMTVSLVAIWSRYQGAGRRFIGTTIALTVAYIVFMCLVDVPMYVRRWRTDEARGKSYLSIPGGWRDAVERRVVTRRWHDWKEEMPWMSLYFSAGVWLSISLVNAPRLTSRPEGVVVQE
jgi:hypothetical protein